MDVPNIMQKAENNPWVHAGCNCRNVCFPISEKKNNRRACPCRVAGIACTSKCKCGLVGYKQYKCTNIELKESDKSDTKILKRKLESVPNDSPSPIKFIEEKAQNIPYTLCISTNSIEASSSILGNTPAPAAPLNILTSTPKVQRKKRGKTMNKNKVDKAMTAAFESQNVMEKTINEAREGFHNELTNAIEELPHNLLVLFAKTLALRIPESMFILNNVISGNTVINGSGQPITTDPLSSWTTNCICGLCPPMATPEEDVCCGRQQCLSQGEDFNIMCLEGVILILAMRLRNEVIIERGFLDLGNDNFRFSAYCNFVLWQYGRLGQSNRVTIPACCVTKIRSVYPSPDGVYTGYRAAEPNPNRQYFPV